MKDIQVPAFYGLTPRQTYIAFAEKFAKPCFGHKFFGRRLLETLAKSEADHYIVADSGFRDEADAVIDHFGIERCLLIRVMRPGADFSKDSRGYWTPPDGMSCTDISNEGSIQALREQLATMVSRFQSPHDPSSCHGPTTP
jgi:hypothetical protein